MKKITIYLLVFMFLVAFSFNYSCKKDKKNDKGNNEQEVCTEHIDANKDGKCDKCGADVKKPIGDNDEFTITYYLNGGSNAKDNVNNYKGSDLPFDLEEPTKNNGRTVFLGWYDNPNFDGDEYTEINEDNCGNLELYACWDDSEVYHKVTYVTDGGTLDKNAKNQYREGMSSNLPKISKEYYEFLGWKENLSDTNYVTKIAATANTDLTFYAVFEEITEYNIKYVYKEGELIETTITSLDEFKEYFFECYYEWSESKKDFDQFVEEELDSWTNGSENGYSLYELNGKDKEVNSSFFNSLGNEEWLKVFNKFSDLVLSIKKTSAWASKETGLVAFADMLKGKYKVLSEDNVKTLYGMIKRVHTLNTTYNTLEDTKLESLTINDGRQFAGWYDEDGNLVDIVKAGTKGDLVLYSKFISPVPVTNFELVDEPVDIQRLVYYQLKWEFTPTDATYKKLTFETKDPIIATISQGGLLRGLNDGKTTVTVHVLDNPELDYEFEVNVYTIPFIDVYFEERTSLIEVQNSLNIVYETYGLSSNEVTFKSNNTSIATVDNNGKVTGVAPGYTDIVVTSVADPNVNISIGVSIISLEDSDFFSIIASAHNPEIHVTRQIHVANTYYADVFCSASDLLFNWNYNINREFEPVQAAISSNHGGKMSSIEFITVHYTGNPSRGANGRANASYFANGGGGTSIHYTAGNDGIFSCLDDSLVGFHAGDGTGTPFRWISTGVTATENVKPEFSVVENKASKTGYYFALNGQETTIEVPTTGTYNSGAPAKLKDPMNAWTFFGPTWKIVNDEYYMGLTWACFTQVWDGVICTHGGNNNSIGIEVACDEGCDLWINYQYTAELVARLLDEHNLDLTRVLGHNAYSGKDCPQVLLAYGGELWYEFFDCVKAEYELYQNMTKNGRYTITCKSNNPEYLSDNGRILKVPYATQSVSYTVTVTDNNTGVTKEATFTSIIHGIYTEKK